MITKSAFLKVCPSCGLHGVIVFSYGRESDEFGTFEDGVKTINEARLLGKIDEHEEKFLITELGKSAILREEDYKNPEIAKKALKKISKAKEDMAKEINTSLKNKKFETCQGRILN